MNSFKHIFSNPLIFIMLLSNSAFLNAQNLINDNIVVLKAQQAFVTGKLKILGEEDSAAIHYWHNTDDIISWNGNFLQAGNYVVKINYSLDEALVGGKFSVIAGGQQIIAEAKPTESWWDFKTFELGVINIDKAGNKTVTIKGVQMPQAKDPALPDVVWVSFTKTGAAAQTTGKFAGTKIFDGETFTGWEGDLTWFRIEDSAVVAGSLQKSIPQNEFLATKKDYSDFELRLKVKLVNGNGNAGVQFRSQRVTNSREMTGYQADVANGFWGGLYDESRRRNFLGTRLNEAETKAALNPDGWNDYVIRCEGPRIRIWLNGAQTIDYMETDPGVPLSGKIGLQIHEGGPSEAWYKDIELEELDAHR